MKSSFASLSVFVKKTEDVRPVVRFFLNNRASQPISSEKPPFPSEQCRHKASYAEHGRHDNPERIRILFERSSERMHTEDEGSELEREHDEVDDRERLHNFVLAHVEERSIRLA